MSALPLVLEGGALSALVVGGGPVALRKVRALLAADVRVRLIALDVLPELAALAGNAAGGGSLQLERGEYTADLLGDALLVIAATDDRALNARVARDAIAARRLVNVADAPETGTFVTPAVHRCGDLVVAVTAGGVPGAASRVRDAIASRFDGRYAGAIGALASLRRRLLDGGRREEWQLAAAQLVGADFCEAVERGEATARVAAWR